MKKVFLSTSFSHVTDYRTGTVQPEFRKSIESILQSLRKEAGVQVFCAMEDEGWKLGGDEPPEIGVKHDIAVIDDADILLALVHDQPSVGVQFEIGYMVAQGKPVILAMQAGTQLAYFNQGLVSAGMVTLITYDDAKSLSRQLAIALHAPGQEPAIAQQIAS